MVHRLPILIALLALLAACGGTPAAVEPTAAPTSAPAVGPTAAPAASATFPVTLEHEYGSTTIPAAPTRVIALGYSDQDSLLALGIQPIAVRKWFGEPAHGVWEWAQAALGDATPQLLDMPFGELNFETIAALNPDLIVGLSAGLSEEEYTTLTQIAPVVAMPEGYPTLLPWQEHTRIVGRATGRSGRAEEVIATVEARLAAVRAAHPEFVGKTVVVAEYLEAGSYYIFDPQNSRIDFLNGLGLEMPEAAKAIHANGTAGGTISAERLDLLEADLLIWGVPTTAQQREVEALPLYQQLAVVREGRDIFLTYDEEPNLISAALSFGTALSIPYLLDSLVPQLAAALGGEAATAPAAASATQTVADDLRRTVDLPASPQRVAALQHMQASPNVVP